MHHRQSAWETKVIAALPRSLHPQQKQRRGLVVWALGSLINDTWYGAFSSIDAGSPLWPGVGATTATMVTTLETENPWF